MLVEVKLGELAKWKVNGRCGEGPSQGPLLGHVGATSSMAINNSPSLAKAVCKHHLR